jgi:hypothetical protein
MYKVIVETNYQFNAPSSVKFGFLLSDELFNGVAHRPKIGMTPPAYLSKPVLSDPVDGQLGWAQFAFTETDGSVSRPAVLSRRDKHSRTCSRIAESDQ